MKQGVHIIICLKLSCNRKKKNKCARNWTLLFDVSRNTRSIRAATKVIWNWRSGPQQFDSVTEVMRNSAHHLFKKINISKLLNVSRKIHVEERKLTYKLRLSDCSHLHRHCFDRRKNQGTTRLLHRKIQYRCRSCRIKLSRSMQVWQLRVLITLSFTGGGLWNSKCVRNLGFYLMNSLICDTAVK